LVTTFFSYKILKYNKKIILGLLIILFSVIGFFIAIALSTPMNPIENAEAVGIFTVNELNTSFHLDEGEYSIYIHTDKNPGNIKVIDPDGNVVFNGEATGIISRNISGEEVKMVGSFSADTSGTYTASSQTVGTIYIGPPTRTMLFVFAFIVFWIAVIIGFIIGRSGVKDALERGEAVFKLDE
jgi:hypothetical protein